VFGDLTHRVPHTPADYHTVGVVTQVTATEATVRVSDTLTYTCGLPAWATATEDGHTHDVSGPAVGDEALLVVLADTAWLLSWRAA